MIPTESLRAATLSPRDVLRVGGHGLRARPMRVVLSALGIAIGIAAMVAVVGISTSSRAKLDRLLDALGTNLLTAGPGSTLFGDPAKLPEMPSRWWGGSGRSSPCPPSETSTRRRCTAATRSPSPSPEASAPTPPASTCPTPPAPPSRPAPGSTTPPPNTPPWCSAQPRPNVSASVSRGRTGRSGSAAGGSPSSGSSTRSRWRPSSISARSSAGRPHSTTSTSTAARPPSTPAPIPIRSRRCAPCWPAPPIRPSPTRSSYPARRTPWPPKPPLNVTFTGLLLGLGAVALLVGGIGVANTMVISVLERRAEIGLRRSLGATRGQIRTQFLTESLLLSTLGGGAGVLLGSAVTAVYASLQGWPTVVPALFMGGAVAAALLIGAVAGLYPAIRAARLAPTEALATT